MNAAKMVQSGDLSTRRKFSWRSLWQLLGPYWWSEEKWAARGLLAVIVTLNLGLVYLNVLFNEWYRLFYDALQNKDYPAFQTQLLRFTVLALIYIAVAVYRIYLNQMLEMRWRRWLTEDYLGRWMAGQTYYRIEVQHGGTDNPDQRIAEDLRLFTGGSLSLSLGLLSSVVTLASFVGILWSLSGDLDFSIAGYELVIPAYMVWGAIIYSFFGSFFAHWIGKPLINLNFRQQQYEADFRFSLVRVRENAEGIALYQGETPELQNLDGRFLKILKNWWEIMKRQKRLTWFTASYGQLAVVFPILVAAPRYFSGAIQLGGMMQVVSAFSNVQNALSWFIDNYRPFAEWKASVDRLTTFHDAVVQVQTRQTSPAGIELHENDEPSLTISDLHLSLPNGRILVNGLNAVMNPGDSVLVRGPSGIGKSTLFRSIAGIWPFGSGRILTPPRSTQLFLPQKPYLPIGTLRDAISYPGTSGVFTDHAIREALRQCHMDPFVERLDEVAHWEQVLSIGEQQRLALARALLHKPGWLFLDEATSALDDTTQAQLYEVLKTELKETSIVSIAHRGDVRPFHERTLSLIGDGKYRMETAAV
jgi:vitamin B12/bleomycin/antimicrobial peptide transport system ATP-binding/permease protein